MSYIPYRSCAVPNCKNTTIKTPQKLFIQVPKDVKTRNVWLKQARRDPKLLSSLNNRLYFCEDHFDLENDMENYVRFKIMGSVKKIIMKPDCRPSRFDCQSDRTCKFIPPESQPASSKGQRLSSIEEIQHNLEDSLAGTPSSLLQDMSCPGVFIKQEKIDETESTYISDSGVVKKEEIADDTESSFPIVSIKQEEGSLFYCGGLIPEQVGEMGILNHGVLSHVKQEEEMIIPDDGELPEELEDAPDDGDQDIKTEIDLDSKIMSSASSDCGRKTVKLKKLQCPHCKYKAVYPSKIKIHVIACHTGEKPHHCPSCDYKATTSSILKKHIKASHPGEKPYRCPHCDFATADIAGLEKHINARNTDREPHECPPGGDTTQSNDIEMKEDPLQCPHCEYKAAYPSKLKMHIMACHTGEKPHQCPSCDYKAVKISNLKIHIMAHHSEEKPYPCPHCDYKTVTHSTLKTHIRYRHTGEKPHQCPHCDYRSVTISCLKKHVMARHLGEKPYKCPHCDYRATQNSNLKTHIKYLHMYLND
ncbi:zinc finger protein 558 [Halyomorpha halys]|uniref:zinc finger protein 558 n=1 Tax=Halyomorpha halys TaxID=286706 RepID=UPI0006D51165|nr:zinc finger protein 711-like [Halyomorpha halys]